MASTKELIFANLIGFLVFLAFCSFSIIGTSEVGLVKLMGVYEKQTLSPGVRFLNPISIVSKVSLKDEQKDFVLKHTQTKDMQPVSASYKVIYRVTDEMALNNAINLSGELFEIIIMPRANESIMDVLSRYPAEEIFTNRDKISAEVKTRLSDRVEGHAIISDIAIVEVDFENDDFKVAVQKKVTARQEAETAEIRKRTAQAEADQMVIRAKAQAETTRIEGQALQFSNSKEYISLKQLEIQKLQLEVQKKWIDKWNGETPTTLITSEKGNSPQLLMQIPSSNRLI
jgi:regulator of protease activity HflC (stomatin/prohibitin superfamily)